MERKGNDAGQDWDRRGLPAWTYHSAAMLKLETEEAMLTHWQIVGHVNDIAKNGDYLTFDLGDERAFVVRGDDGTVRAFHNLCRHRGSRVVTGDKGHCKHALVCPFHGWVYNLNGTLRGAARPQSYPPLDKHAFGLKPIESEIWQGFIFLRFKAGPQGSVADYLSPYLEDVAPHRMETMVPAGTNWGQELPVNWKSVRDVDNEGYHVAMAHPALQDLYGSTYYDVSLPGGLNVSKGTFQPHAGRRWSVRNYLKWAGGPSWLPAERRNLWAYYGIFPNAVIITTPETVQFYQELPIAPDRTRVRGMIYRYPEEDRALRMARYLSYRIDRETVEEDIQLSTWSNESMKSSAFDGFYLSDLEKGVRAHHDELRQLLPVMKLDKAPQTDDLEALNARMRRA
ncbi:MAG: aromatic ring-hydroxylating dioxygenase subunit alpha [Proteobacteria bacterium]|nr:aromatic ring-hydroxylating dioxygenase subunit alpha [Pseudomonadota bacterium]